MTDEIIQLENGSASIEAVARAEYDIQISTAKRFPRNLAKVRENCVAIVTMDKETAESCRYTLPRGDKKISGESVHLARVLAQQYGNIRVEARVVQITETQVVSEAVAFDLETNYASKVEIRKSIIGKSGRFNEDMITMTCARTNAIAYRNAVLSVIPKGIITACSKASLQLITGDLSDENKLIKSRNTILEKMKAEYSVSEAQILKAIGVNSVNQIRAEQIADLIGLAQAIKDGDTTVQDTFFEKLALGAISDEAKNLQNPLK